MAGWLNVRTGILLSAVIFVGIAAFAYYAPPKSQYMLDRRLELDRQRNACIEAYRDTPRQGWWCEERFRPRYESLETQERWLPLGLAVGAGAAGVAILWLLIYLFYLRPRRSRGV